jgi:hypothetical protein
VQNGIDVSKGRTNLDFNPSGESGFYMTKDLSQAHEWAGPNGRIVKFNPDPSEVSALNGKVFNGPSTEWQKTVVAGRTGNLQHQYDYVEGPMLRNVQGAVHNGEIPIPKGHQIAIFTPRAVNVFNPLVFAKTIKKESVRQPKQGESHWASVGFWNSLVEVWVAG